MGGSSVSFTQAAWFVGKKFAFKMQLHAEMARKRETVFVLDFRIFFPTRYSAIQAVQVVSRPTCKVQVLLAQCLSTTSPAVKQVDLP